MSNDNLELMLVELTNPLNKECNLTTLNLFCQQVELDEDGPQMSLRFLAHKIQSPQEREAMQALTALEEIIKNSGPNLIAELGKFRFLNELIKTISPKYLGNRTSHKVKEKIIELMFKWSMEIKKETKIFDAYQMLKTQGIVKSDPIYVLEQPPEPFKPPPPRPKNVVFEDEEKSKVVVGVMQVAMCMGDQIWDGGDLREVLKADHRMELVQRRVTEVETVKINANVLSDMLNCYKAGETSEEEKELMKELYESSLRLRPKLFRLAGEMDEKDEGLSDILKANDQLNAVITKYTEIMESGGDATRAESALLDLSLPPKEGSVSSENKSLLDDQLLALGLNEAGEEPVKESNSEKEGSLSDLGQLFSTPAVSTSLPDYFSHSFLRHSAPGDGATSSLTETGGTPPSNNLLEPLRPLSVEKTKSANDDETEKQNASGKSLDCFDALGQMIKQSLPSSGAPKLDFPSTPQKIPMNLLQKQSTLLRSAPFRSSSTGSVNVPETERANVSSKNSTVEVLPLDIFVPLESIKPGDISPLTLPEKNGLTVVIHFGKDRPRSDVTVMVVSTMSKNPSPVKSFSFLAAVPKTMKIKLQSPSATDLPAYNPILPPAAITQVLLLANPNREKVRLKYKLSYCIDGQQFAEAGEIENLLGPR
ncbi:ADP-ribosylation factor-binding protein GGA1-like [Centruroides sculpturatus]|uniref:ADP-ribosylation factor-binding protein GGA1-like n=1 Tax=Centruroides sculpturatus TaxID=218467 RepID=UPI000C6E4660|nr:ADP-ribosylation factor-binding protein GGA1-like [Centruroides sculpturatus]